MSVEEARAGCKFVLVNPVWEKISLSVTISGKRLPLLQRCNRILLKGVGSDKKGNQPDCCVRLSRCMFIRMFSEKRSRP